MASTTLPNGIIVPEKFSRDWYADLYHNWQELDNLLGGGTPKDGTLTIQKNGDTVGTFSANQATDETINITVPDVNNGTLTIQQNGTTVDTFTANSSSDKTVNIQCVDLENNQTVGGDKEFTGTTTAHDLVPSATDTYNFGSSTAQWNNAYIKSLTINGVACGDILTHNVSEFVDVSSRQTIGGIKSFKDVIIRNVGNFTAGEAPTSQTTCMVLRHTNNDGTHSANTIMSYMFNTGETMCELTQNPCIGSIARTWFRTNTDGTYSIYSYTRNGSLGTSSYKWKDVQTEKINNINPGALSLPGTSVNVDTTNWVLDGTANAFTPTSDGWLGIQAVDTVYDQMHYVFVGRTADGSTYYQQNVLSPINALWNGEYHGCVFIPVIKNVSYDIRCICNSIIATFYPCQGNV